MKKFSKPTGSTRKTFHPKARRPPHQGQGSSHRSPHHHRTHSETRMPPSADQARFFSGVAVDPFPRIRLEDGLSNLTTRAMDLICPIGMGQRGLIVAPPGSGKTTFLKHLCQAVAGSCPDMKRYCLLIDERPEEVTDFKRTVSAQVRWSSSDQSYENHVAAANELMTQAYREASQGEDVLVLIDSLTRLARVHNAQQRSGGRTLSGGVDARALEVPRRIFGSARKIENGGSLTILATILVDTGSRMDQVIFEEFKGTGNMEIFLSREVAGHRIFPAIDILKSGTRKEELLIDADEIEQIRVLRRALASLGTVAAVSALIEQIQKYPTNKALLAAIKNHL